MLGQGLIIVAVLGVALTASGEFVFEGDVDTLTLREGETPVLTYIYGTALPEGIDERFRRGGYIHPLFGLDGDRITEDFPGDHYHHRGVFWAWPQAHHGDRHMDIWHLGGVRSRFSRFVELYSGPEEARLAVENIWSWDETQEVPVVVETMHVTVHPAKGDVRILDFRLELENVSDETVALRGQVGAGYGGFNIRPDSARSPLQFTTIEGLLNEDRNQFQTPWAAVTLSPDDAGVVSGAAICQHPDNPGFPHDGWTIRHYGFLGAAYPGNASHDIEPGATETFRYRVIVYRESPEAVRLAELFDEYLSR